MGGPNPVEVRARLLAWFDANRRDLPWRRTKDPYRILVAEYMLQRTRVASGTPYYLRFLNRFPTVRDLAAASLEDVLRMWEGLGFYGRARNLHAAARAIVDRHAGEIPRDPDALRSLPGMGPYTAGAVASIAFGIPAPAVDGNATRVVARLYRIAGDVTRGAGASRIREAVAGLIPTDRPGEFNQALMELGAIVCVPASPKCEVCPLSYVCLARAAGLQGSLPHRTKALSREAVRVVFAFIERDGRVLLVRRPEKGLLAGLWALPGGEDPGRAEDPEALRRLVRLQAGVAVRTGPRIARVAHTFSHRRWSGSVYRCTVESRVRLPAEARWATSSELRTIPVVPFLRRVLEREAMASAAR